ncbi:MAG: translation initiation factor IF-2 [Desulfovibrio sp.]|nr:translation initiation factor IF-2 [Desulfovibrio sp.]
MANGKKFWHCLLCLFFLFFLGLLTEPLAKTVYTPRDSGTNPPGGPRNPEGLPSSGSFGRTAEGGMGYTDAYGNTITNETKEKTPHRRLPGGAYGRYEMRDPKTALDRPLPDPDKGKAKPAWSF